MSCHCYFIPKYIEERVRNKDISPKALEISDEFRSHRQSLKYVLDSPSKNHVFTAKNRRYLPGSLVAASISDAAASKDPDAICAWIFSDYFARFCRMINHEDPMKF